MWIIVELQNLRINVDQREYVLIILLCPQLWHRDLEVPQLWDVGGPAGGSPPHPLLYPN